jgi:hypothetical protein
MADLRKLLMESTKAASLDVKLGQLQSLNFERLLSHSGLQPHQIVEVGRTDGQDENEESFLFRADFRVHVTLLCFHVYIPDKTLPSSCYNVRLPRHQSSNVLSSFWVD